jgi:hypothetical protein
LCFCETRIELVESSKARRARFFGAAACMQDRMSPICLDGSESATLCRSQRSWGNAIVERDIAKIRQIVAPDVVLTTPDGTVQSLDDDLAELQSGAFTAELYDFFRYQGKALW